MSHNRLLGSVGTKLVIHLNYVESGPLLEIKVHLEVEHLRYVSHEVDASNTLNDKDIAMSSSQNLSRSFSANKP